MIELKNEQAILNLIGKDTVFKFEVAADGVLTYKSVLPKRIGDEIHYFAIDVFFSMSDDFLLYDTLKDVMYKKQVFRVVALGLSGGSEELYFSKFKEH